MPFSNPKPCFWLPDLACRECILEKKKVICLSAFRLDSLWFQTWWTNFCPSKFIPFIVPYSPIKSDKEDSGCYFLISYCESQVGMHLEHHHHVAWRQEAEAQRSQAHCSMPHAGSDHQETHSWRTDAFLAFQLSAFSESWHTVGIQELFT